MRKYLPLFESALFYIFIVLLVLIPLYPKFPLFRVEKTFTAIRIEDLLIAGSLFLWGFNIILSKKVKELLKEKLMLSLLLFFFVGAVSLFSAIFLTHTVLAHLGVLHFFRRIEFMMLLPLTLSVIKSRKQLKVVLIALSGVLLIVNLYAFGQQYFGWPVISTTNSEFAKGQILKLTPGARVNSTFAGHYDLAIFLTMSLVILSALFFGLKQIFLRLGITILSALSFIVLVMTAARLSFVAALVGITSVFIIFNKKLFIVLLFIAAAVALIYPSQLRDRFISTITVNLQQQGSRYRTTNEHQNNKVKLNIPTLPDAVSWTRGVTPSAEIASDIVPGEPVNITELGVYRSFGIRLYQEWPRALRAFYKNPLIGGGYSSLGLAVDNDFLRILGEVGLIGTASFSLVLIEVVKRLWRMFKQDFSSSEKYLKYLLGGVLCMIIAFLVNGLFIDVFEASKTASLFWIITGVALAAGKVR